MILVTTDTICGKEVEALGLVKGSTVQTVNAIEGQKRQFIGAFYEK